MSIYCGQCNLEFEDELAELDHICSVTGVKPTEPETMGVNWNTIQAAALDRGSKETTKEKLTIAKTLIRERLLEEKSKLKPKLNEAEKLELVTKEAEILE